MAKESVGAIWRKSTKTGKEFLSITIGDKRYTAWLNDYKKKPTEPDFKMYVDDYQSAPQQQPPAPKTSAQTNTKTFVEEDTNDLPF